MAKKAAKKESLLLGALLQRLAPKIGANVILEPEWHIVGQITFKSGKRCYFRYNALDLNPVGSSDVSKDKDYATFFMQRMGYPVPRSGAFYSEEHNEQVGAKRGSAAAYRYAKKIGFPVIVKPNSGSQGKDVFLVHNRSELDRALRAIFKHDKIALVQEYVRGRDYRIVVLDGDVISAYERIPLSVTGDGVSTIRQLLQKKGRDFAKSGRDTRIALDDARIRQKLRRNSLTLSHKLKRDEHLFLLDNANLSSGGDAVDVTGSIHPDFAKLAIDLTRDMGLRLCGVDVMVDGSIAQKPDRYWILETNAAPGLDHYVKSGPEQQKIVEDLYLRVLKSLEN